MNTHRNDFSKQLFGVCLAVLCFASLGASAADPAPGPVTYTRDVAPILNANCVECHRPGEVAPMSMRNYAEVRPWATSIKEKVSNREMPPWFADPAHGAWVNDSRLSEEEIDTIVRWVDQGATRGNPNDMPDLPEFSQGWRLGEPDHIITLPLVNIPGEEGADYYPEGLGFTADIPEDRWIQALEIRPSNLEVAHHIVIFSIGGGGLGGPERSGNSNFGALGVWSVGTEPNVFPEGYGRKMASGQRYMVNAHYHQNGTKTTDQTRIGLHFGEGEMQHEVMSTLAGSFTFSIPPGEANHAEVSSWHLDRDIKILSLFPHMHLRGKDMKFSAVYPDGREDILLNIPEYDFDWQLFYYPEEMLSLPAGTRLDLAAHWDNSADNPNNPDPTKTVTFGLSTTDEMMFGVVEYIFDGEAPAVEVSAEDRLRTVVASLPQDDLYAIDFKIGGSAVPSMLYLPREGEGKWIVSFNGMNLTLPAQNLSWNADAFEFKMTLRFGEIGGDFDVKGSVEEAGEIVGSIAAEDGSRSFLPSDFDGSRLTGSD